MKTNKQKKANIGHLFGEGLKANKEGKYPLYVKVTYDNQTIRFKSETNLYLSIEELENPGSVEGLEERLLNERNDIERFLRYEVKHYPKFTIKGFADRYRVSNVTIYELCIFYAANTLFKPFFTEPYMYLSSKYGEFHEKMLQPLNTADEIKNRFLDSILEQKKYCLLNTGELLQKNNKPQMDKLCLDLLAEFDTADIEPLEVKKFYRIKTFFELLIHKKQPIILDYETIRRQFTLFDGLEDRIKDKFDNPEHPQIKQFLSHTREFLEECRETDIYRKYFQESQNG